MILLMLLIPVDVVHQETVSMKGVSGERLNGTESIEETESEGDLVIVSIQAVRRASGPV
jgi:hypothetical protein